MLTSHNPWAGADAQLTHTKPGTLPCYKSEEGRVGSRGGERVLFSAAGLPLYQVRETGKVHFEMASS